METVDEPSHRAAPVPLLSVVVPVFNERAVLTELQQRLFAVLEASCPDYEVIFVDDGSIDESPAILLDTADANPRVRVLRFSRNFGHQAAVTAGIEHARGRAVVVIDADLFASGKATGTAILYGAAAATVFTESTNLTDADRGKTLWKLADLGAGTYTADPGGIWAICADFTTIEDATSFYGFEIDYVSGD